MSEKELTGKIRREWIYLMEVPRMDPQVLAGFRELEDLSGTISDAMDEMGIVGVVPSSVLRPTIPGARIVGTALTLRNVIQRNQAYKGAKDRISKMAEIEGHNLAQPGDVLVIEGIDGISNMGGISSAIGKRQGEVGAIVDGGVRDVESSRKIQFPIWSRSITPITGKWRVQTVSVNGTIQVAGIQVSAGDVVVADEGGVCFIPRDQAVAVLKRVREIAEGEARRYADVEAGVPVPELAKKTHVYKFSPQ